MNLIRAAALVALALGGCNLENPGFDAPVGELSYPVAITLSDPSAKDGPAYLYVANSNFILRYNGGSVQSYDLEALEEAMVEKACIAKRGELELPDAGADAGAPDDAEVDAEVDAADMDASGGSDPDAALGDAQFEDGAASEGGATDAEVDGRVPPLEIDAGPLLDSRSAQPRLCDGRSGRAPELDPCCFTKRSMLDPFRASEVSIDSYASAIATSPDGRHVYVPVRSDSRLVFLDVDDDGKFGCGDETGRCRRGPVYGRASEIDDDIEYPALPNAVLTGSFSQLNVTERSEKYFVATAHEDGELSLFALNNGTGSPKFLYAIRGASAKRAASLRMDDGFFLISAAGGGEITRVGARSDIVSNVDRDPVGVYLYSTQAIVVRGLTSSPDIRDAQPDERDIAAGIPNRYYALLRGGGGGTSGNILQSVGFLELDRTSPDGRYARAVDAVRVGNGLTKMLQTDVGKRHLLFVSCFKDGEIHVIDADKRQTVSVIRDVLGPTDMQIDRARSLLYVTDFSASVIRVIDLYGLAKGEGGVPRVVATLGAPYFSGTVK